MKLTLGQAAKEVGISKPSLSAAIKNGRISAYKNESGSYEIDPAELFRVYPPQSNANRLADSNNLPQTNPQKLSMKGGQEQLLDLLLAERDKLIAEKEKAIQRLEREKAEIRQDLEDQKEHAKKMTLLLEHKQSPEDSWRQALQMLETRIANKNHEAQRELEEFKRRAHIQISKYKRELQAERTKPFWKRLFG